MTVAEAVKDSKSGGLFNRALIEYIDERRHVVLGAVDTVHTVVDGNEANIGIGKDHLSVHADLKVVSAQP